MNYITVAEEKAPDLVNYIAQRAQWKGSIPFMVALDTKGDVQFVQAGMIPEESLEELISELSTAK
jgi:predicted transcriptional regulator